MQVIWAFMHKDSFKIMTEGDFFGFQKKCKRKTFKRDMNKAIGDGRSDLAVIKGLYQDYSIKTEIKEINRICNYIKHNGTLYLRGFDDKFEKMYSAINYNTINSFPRESYGFDEIEGKLLAFDVTFQEYFNQMIESIMPADYI